MMRDGRYEAEQLKFVQRCLEHVAYKPHWHITTIPGDDGFVYLRIEAMVFDSVAYVRSGEKKLTMVASKKAVPFFYLSDKGDQTFLHWLRSTLIEMEIHELDEFLHDPTTKTLYNDPHKEFQ